MKEVKWISFSDEKPSLGVEIEVMYPNGAYNDMICYTTGVRIDEKYIKCKNGIGKYLINKPVSGSMFQAYATHWRFIKL